MPILPEHIYGKFDYKKIADQKFDRAARRHRAVHARGVEDRPVRALRAQPELLGQAGLRRRGRPAVLPGRHGRHGPGAEVGRARLRPRRQPGPVQGARRPTRRTRRSRARRTAGPSSPSTPTAPGPARRSRTAARRRRRCSTRRSATPSATPSTTRRSSTACSAASGTSGNTIVPPVLSDWHVEPDNAPHLRHRARQAEARRGGLPPRRERQAPRQGGQADRPAPRPPEHERQLRQVRPVREGVVRRARRRRQRAELRQRHAHEPGPAAPGRARRTTTSSCGAGSAARTRTA